MDLKESWKILNRYICDSVPPGKLPDDVIRALIRVGDFIHNLPTYEVTNIYKNIDDNFGSYELNKMYLSINHHTSPKLIPENTDQYVVAHCRCPVDTKYGLIIHKDNLDEGEKQSGVCCMYCSNCNTSIYKRFKEINNDNRI